MALQLIEGGSLASLLARGPLPPSRAADLLRGVASALDYAHGQGVLHRDVKPSNVLLGQGSHVYLADFGLARMLEASIVLSATGTVMGTPQYMAPEQAMPDPDRPLDGRADVYALGIVAYEMLVGAPPFNADTPLAVLLKHVKDPVPVPPAGRVPEALLRPVLRALAKERDDRWPTATEFVEALARAASGVAAVAPLRPDTSGAVLPPSAPTAPALAVTGPAQEPVADQGRKSWVRPAALWAVAPVLALGLAVVAVKWPRQDTPSPPPASAPTSIQSASSALEPVITTPTATLAAIPSAAASTAPSPVPEPQVATPAPSTSPARVASMTPKPEPSATPASPPSAAPTAAAATTPNLAALGSARHAVDGLEYVHLPAGTFEMGCAPGDDPCEEDALPRHKVELSRPFWLGRTEVTVAAFEKFVAATKHRTDAEKSGEGVVVKDGKAWGKREGVNWRSPGFAQGPVFPVVHVDRDDAHAFCEWSGGRLPTEAEWEFAARAGRPGLNYVWGESPQPLVDGRRHANLSDEALKRAFPKWVKAGWKTIPGYDDGYPHTAPVGSFAPNGFGLFDMAGNVWEWCSDLYSKSYYGSSPARDPKGRSQPDGPFVYGDYVARGGSWTMFPRPISDRSASGEGTQSIGFRCARDRPPS
jgi:serine/threonine-protein kinase